MGPRADSFRGITMKTLKSAVMALGTVAVILAVVATPTATALASTSASAPSTQVTSEAPINTGPSRSECLTPDFDDTGPQHFRLQSQASILSRTRP